MAEAAAIVAGAITAITPLSAAGITECATPLSGTGIMRAGTRIEEEAAVRPCPEIDCLEMQDGGCGNGERVTSRAEVNNSFSNGLFFWRIPKLHGLI